MAERPTWDEYFMEIAGLVSTSSTCLRRQVGAVLVKGKRMLATGYNGAPSGLVHCADKGCRREAAGIPSGQRHELCRAIHAEQNALLQAAMYGVAIEGAVMYTTTQPCVLCAKMIVQAGVKEVVMMKEYPDEEALSVLHEGGVQVRSLAPQIRSI